MCTRVFLWFCCILVLVDGRLMPVMENEEDNEQLLNSISQLYRYVPIKNFITFLRNEDLAQQNSITASFQQRLMETFGRPVIVAGAHIGTLHNIINDKNLAVVLINGIHDPILNVVDSTMSQLKTAWIIFVYRLDDVSPLSYSDLKTFFDWCWRKDFAKVLLYYKKMGNFEVWSYEVKSEMEIFKFSDKLKGGHGGKRAREFINMEQYRSLIAVYPGFSPDTFLDKSSRTVTLGGQTGLLLGEFMRIVNGSMDFLELHYEDYIREINEGCQSKQCIDIGANLISNVSVSPLSPWVMTTRTCLVLPDERRIPLKQYSLSGGKRFSLVVFAAFYLLVNTVIKRLANPNAPFVDVLYRSFTLVLGQTMATRAFRRLRLPEKFITMATLAYSSLILSIVASALTSALIAGFYKPKIVDVMTFLDSGLRIMVFPQQMSYFYAHLPAELNDRILMVDMETRNRHLLSLNDSYAYVSQSHRWLAIEYIQRRLVKPKLRLASDTLCGVDSNLKFYVRPGLQFTFELNNFIKQAQESGLTKKWTQMGLRQAQEAGMLVQAPYESHIRLPLPPTFFVNCFFLYVTGLLLSLMAFLAEFAYRHWKNRNSGIIIV